MSSLRLLATAGLLMVSAIAYAQKVHLKEGSLELLNGIRKINVKFDYSNMAVEKKDRATVYS